MNLKKEKHNNNENSIKIDVEKQNIFNKKI